MASIFCDRRKPQHRARATNETRKHGEVYAEHDCVSWRCYWRWKASTMFAAPKFDVLELFEETGMLLGRKETAATSRELDALQKRTKAKPSDFKLACPSPPVENLLEWSTWLTPFSHKQRYMTSFFIALMDAELPVQMCEMEMSHYSWMAPKNCLEQANEGKIILPLPQYYELTRISQVPIDKLHEYGNISVVICPQIVKWQDHSMMSSILPGDYLYSDTNNYQQPVRSMTRADVQVDPKKPTHRAECSTQPLYSNCRSSELAAALEYRRIDLCALQETRWSGSKSRDIGRGFKVLYFGSHKTMNGVGVAVSERFRDSIAEVKRFSDRFMKIIVVTEERRVHFFTAYAPQTGCSEEVKDEFWALLHEKTAEIPSEEMVIVAGDLNGHVGISKEGFKCHGGFGYGIRIEDGERILEYACSHNLGITNTMFQKRPSHLISFYSGNTRSQIDVLVRRRDV
ncbi:hypothetical protein Q1695_005977 [Nippostrongylus brasiliensis]|nr:hypothetical protein Q1695_005977 [Nippostrongylus brasiliensis]